jgi:hypothetical protein
VSGIPLTVVTTNERKIIWRKKMNNSRAILTINPSENITLTLQSSPGVGLLWHFTRGSGFNGAGVFSVQTIPVARINCFDSQNSRLVMTLEGIPSRPRAEFPFLMEDQRNPPASGNLIISVENLPLARGDYTWTVYQVVPSAYVQSAR